MPRFHRVVRYSLLRYGAALFAYIGVSTERCGSVRFGAARFTYISVSSSKSWARSRNKRTEPTYYSLLLRWVTKPSERVAKMWNYTRRFGLVSLFFLEQL